MKDEYDMSQAKRGAIVPPEPNQTRITIRIDTELLDWLREKVNRAGGGNYQTIINQALREYIQYDKEPLPTPLSVGESTLRRVIREELQVVGLQA
ncbi:MAG: BrnA antitoxin family protein [Thiomargarita sp.]|nr:BrnA antitoxin family protein [Thiomargarita sp.]